MLPHKSFIFLCDRLGHFLPVSEEKALFAEISAYSSGSMVLKPFAAEKDVEEGVQILSENLQMTLYSTIVNMGKKIKTQSYV